MAQTDQQGQTVEGHQINAGGDVNVDQIGDRIDTGGGDYVGRDQIINIYGEREQEKPPLSFEPETILIPEGPFLMGDDDDPVARPQHQIELPAYYIGRYPVTNRQYARFLWDTGAVAPKELLWDGNQPPPGEERFPVAGVTWYEALAYCRWLAEQTGRPYTLPDEAQWEKAARGTDGRRHPWGDEWDPARCSAEAESLAAVGDFPAQSPYGCYDMVGNAREWTATLWGTSPREPDSRYRYPWSPDGRNDLSAPETTWRVYRGGRASTPARLRCAVRRGHPPDDGGPKRNRHGFRVAYPAGD